MKKQNNLILKTGLIILVTCFLCSCEKKEFEINNSDLSNNSSSNTSLKSSAFNLNLAKRWAPIHRQDVDATGTYALSGRSDYITAINFDGDWVGTNNWDNIANTSYSPTAHCYYSVVETSTHWFVLYNFFHPRDWTDNPFLYTLDQHENDLEGVLMVVEKDGSTYGDLQAAVTVYHSDFYSYVPSTSQFEENYIGIRGTIDMQSYNGELHPVTVQEPKGHGLRAYPDFDIDGDGVIYYPSMDDVAEAPESNYDTDVKYKLVDVFESGGLWDQRYNSDLFSGGSFVSSVGSGSANAPWNWDDSDDEIPRGYLAYYPASLVADYYTNLGTYSFLYTDNGYSGSVMSEGAYQIVAKHSSKLLDVSGASTENGASIIQWENTGGDNQIWRIISVGDGYHYLESKNSDKVIDVYNLLTDDGTDLIQWDYYGTDNQLWSFSEPESGYYYITSKLSGKVIDVEGAYTYNGANVWQWSLTEGDNQRFQLVWARAIDY